MNPTQEVEESSVTELTAVGMTAAEVAKRFGVHPSTLRLLQGQIHSLLALAIESGIPAMELATLAGDEIRPFVDQKIREGYATPEEGLTALLGAEGGCVSVLEACVLFRKPDPVTRQALTEQIRKGLVIAYRTGGGQYVVPKWQFRPEGGVIDGLPAVLAAIRDHIPGASQLSPFTFLLQADPVTGGRRPIDAIRAGDLKSVFRAIEARAG